MRKTFFIATLIIITAIIIYACNNKAKEPTAAVSKEDSVAAVIEHGRYLANNVSLCMDCHSQRDFTKFSGPIKAGTEGIGGDLFDQGVGIPGELTAPNITPAAIGDWTDEEIINAFTGGRRKNGDTLFPLMPYMHYAKMSRSDINSIVAYIRTLKSAENKTAPRKLMVPISVIMPQLPPVDIDKNVKPDPSDKIKYGEYMVNASACFDCHTRMTQQGFDFANAYAGGQSFTVPGFSVTTGNITPDSATGIGSWTEEVFLAKFKTNSSDAMINTTPGKFNTIMPWKFYGNMTDDDLKAIYAYLRTVPAIKNKVEKWPK